ncbi:MAG: hypothetical protein EHM18_00450 [Acidobacteria bacterium]|nr:MAG: hypothetical protein EHM18_00450 [Acidobacteriota bacterium]
MMPIGAGSTFRIGDKRVIRTMARDLLVRCLRYATLGISFLALLAPSFAGVLPLLQDPASCCGMSCCAESKRCCCRMPDDASLRGSVLTAAPACPSDCGRRAGLPGPDVLTLVYDRVAAGRVAPAELLADYTASAYACTRVEFALFERPPPSI